ncbi:MAG: gamma carbonic anhydrase family protein [Candidatus Binatia bacterium]
MSKVFLSVISRYLDRTPEVSPEAWVADDARVIGDAVIGAGSSVWFQAVIRADVSFIRIGKRSNVQDHCTIHVTRDGCPTIIGDEVTLGHRVVAHGCRIHDGALLGIGCVLLDHAEIGEGALVGAMSLVTPGTVVPAGALVMGQPARVVRAVSDEERAWMKETVESYASLARDYVRCGP